jgi:uncharacterized protein
MTATADRSVISRANAKPVDICNDPTPGEHAWYVRRVTVDANEIRDVLQAELPKLVPGLAAAYLFGSIARGEAGPGSDVDVGLLYETTPASRLLDQPFLAAAELESRLGRRVDLVVMNTAPVDLVHRVLRDGLLLLQSNPSARIAFEVRARNAYFDLLPILKRYRRSDGAA